MNWLKTLLLVTLIAGPIPRARGAEVIELPEEELAKESVLPVFDKPTSVKNRNIVTAGRFDLNLSYGLALSEPIFNSNRYGGSIYYNTGSENHAFGLLYVKNSNGLSSYAKQLDEQFKLDFTRAPAPDQTMMLDWNMKMFYGKMSLSKDTVFNTSLYTTLAGGMVKFSHKSYPAVAAGLGQKFYFGPHFALRFDFRLFVNKAPIPFLDSKGCTQPGINESCTTQPKPTPDDFDERITYTTVLDAGLSWLF